MILTCSPIREEEDMIARVALAQVVPPPPPPPQPALPTPAPHNKNPLKIFVNKYLLGSKHENSWFWFLTLFLFCVFLLGMNFFLVGKVESMSLSLEQLVQKA